MCPLIEARRHTLPVREQIGRGERPFLSRQRVLVTLPELLGEPGGRCIDLVALGDDDPAVVAGG